MIQDGLAPLAMLAWAIRFPYLGGAAQRLSWLAILVAPLGGAGCGLNMDR